jgi:hypothetical protein
MLPRTLLILALLLTAAATARGDETALEYWLSTSDTAPIGPEAPQLDMAVGSSVDLYLWCRPTTGTNLRNFSLHVVAEQSGLDLVDGSFEVFNSVGPGVDRFEFVTDSALNPPLVSEYSELEVAAGDADSLLNLQGFTIFPSATIAGIGPVCGAGELDCDVPLEGGPAWLLGTLSVKAVTAGAVVDLHLQVGDFGMNQVTFPSGDYDFSGLVDDLDYEVWSTDFDSKLNLAADGNGDGTVDAADYTVWRDDLGATSTLQPTSEVLVQFGLDATPESPQETYNALTDRGITIAGDDPDAVIHVAGPAAGLGGVAAPEPTTLVLAIFALAVAAQSRSLKR